ncbi:MAG: hypothetical protein GWM98_18120 [Nitrospinaceae bacterium]|nr:hypothetical protein [Nitrospinaceae bacterium]NIR56060.1 hypothetical protein [Nitrospinaceae bacterium]NIS86505.1 hypothetical protein [Nitrospinaceae bacterium]NIT83340.1 hypothetical protein [Nitrospinaceae bacterium]NIU45549.1 hypothetical protein [Nitrospinaceae bacterium]
MDFRQELTELIHQIQEESETFQKAATPEEEIEALNELADSFLMGTQKVREQLDRFQDRRWR